MLNIKRIGIAFSVLALAGLIGALMAGPAFAAPKGSSHDEMKYAVCHYQEFEAAVFEFDEELGVDVLVTEEQRAEWAMIDVDMKSLKAHLGRDGDGAHTDGDGYSDFIIDDGDFLEDGETLDTSNDTSVCDRLVASTAEVEVEVD